MRKGLLLVGLVLLLAAPLMLMLRGFARGAILVPFLYVLWAADLFFKSVPQPLFWALFLVFALFISAKSLFTGKMPARRKREAELYDKGQVHVLARWVHLAARGGYFKWRLAQHLRELTVEVLAYHEGTTPGQIKRQLRKGRLDAPSEIQTFLQAGLKPLFSRPAFLFSRLLDRFRPRSKPSLLNLGPESVVQFLEDHLEIEHDHRNR